ARSQRPARSRRQRQDRRRRQRAREDRGVPRREAPRLMATLVFLEHHAGEFATNSLGVLSKAATFGGDVHGVVIGSGVRALAARAGTFGATSVHVADDASLEAPLSQPRGDVIAKLAEAHGYDTVLFRQSVLAADVAAALAARLEAGLNWDLIDIVQQDGTLVGKRPA